MLVLSNNVVFLLSMGILFILLFFYIDNNAIITVQSSLQDTQTIKKSNPDMTSNFTNVQWKKFVNETIGISFEYPSYWEGGTGREGYYQISPKTDIELYPAGEYPVGTAFELNYGEPLFDNLKVLTRMIATDVLDPSSEDTQYQFIEKPTIEKYIIDGETAGSFSYREIYSNPETSNFFVLNVEEIILIHENKFFNFQFSYKESAINEEYINKIKDHMFNSINWIGNETVKENPQSLNNQSISVKDPKDPLKYDNTSKVISTKINGTNNQNNNFNNITIYNNYTNDIVGIKLQYPSDWHLNEDDKVKSSCIEKICNIFFYRNLKYNDISNIDTTTNNNSVALVISGEVLIVKYLKKNVNVMILY